MNTTTPPKVRPSEQRVLVRIASGLTNTQIAAALGLSVNTVATYVRRILRSLGARDRAHAAALGIVFGLVDPALIQPRA